METDFQGKMANLSISIIDMTESEVQALEDYIEATVQYNGDCTAGEDEYIISVHED